MELCWDHSKSQPQRLGLSPEKGVAVLKPEVAGSPQRSAGVSPWLRHSQGLHSDCQGLSGSLYLPIVLSMVPESSHNIQSLLLKSTFLGPLVSPLPSTVSLEGLGGTCETRPLSALNQSVSLSMAFILHSPTICPNLCTLKDNAGGMEGRPPGPLPPPGSPPFSKRQGKSLKPTRKHI